MEREPLRTGQIDMLLLAIVARGPVHGYAVIEQLRLRSAGAFDLPEGTVYPALYRLERLALLESGQHEVAGRTRRTYRITRAGRQVLREREQAWRRLVEGVDAVLHA
ncbi:MAG TPA: helix-turn-helix transcriptional regulator [Candidatus Polarisedimenticolaceae bacterium]|nr:helix-turn-helix transcriptional regulator [Candidatus Polarisedimenticolaceae bacterium]